MHTTHPRWALLRAAGLAAALVAGLALASLASLPARAASDAATAVPAAAPASAPADALSPAHAAGLWASRCAGCHDAAQGRTPSRAALATWRPEELIATASTGSMREQARGLSADEIRAIARHLTGRDPVAGPAGAAAAGCLRPPAALDAAAPQWQGWGNGPQQTRFQARPGFTAADLPRLRVRWVYAYAATMAIGQPVVAGDRVYASTQSGEVLALDARSGCQHWSAALGTAARTAVVLGPTTGTGAGASGALAYIGDEQGRVQALDADSGALVWRVTLDPHAAARITGTPLLHQGRLLVPVSSGEEGLAQDPRYPCCSFRGSVVALDAATGQRLWQTLTITESRQPYRVNEAGTQQQGPAGGAVWASPTLDARRGLLYIGTGNSYTDQPTRGSNAVIALDIQTGQLHWQRQLLPADNYVLPCNLPGVKAGSGNCPATPGPDHDFGAPLVLVHRPGQPDLLLAGQKSGALHALSPDDGRLLWQAALGAGSALGGIQWGMASDADTVYVPMADPYRAGLALPRPGLSAVALADGRERWFAAAPQRACAWDGRCLASYSAAVAAMPGIVWAGASDGHLRAYATADGRTVLDIDTAAHDWQAVNGGVARGGSIDNGGPVLAGGMVFVNSGYGRIWAHAGNALIALSVDGQ